MFILKFFIFLLILFAVIYNGLVILNTPNIETAERMLNIALYLIIVIVITNYTISYITYHQNKNKRGLVGDTGIQGDKGNTGKSAVCEADCGRKICYINVLEHANLALNNNLDKVKGSIELKYNVDPEIAYKNLNRIKRQLIKKIRIKYGIFSLPSDDEGNVSRDFIKIFVKNDGVRIRISNSKTVVDGIIKDFYKGDLNSKKYLTIFINGPKNPEIVIEDLEALNKCIEESSDDYVPSDESLENENNILVEICTDNSESQTRALPTTESTTETNVNEFISNMYRKLKINNEFFIEKIQKICNSEEYISALEKKTKEPVNEEKLINYIKETIEEMVNYIVNFKVRRVGGGQKDGEIINAGLNFLFNKTADKNYFNIYRTGPDKDDIIKSPIKELEKYDIFRWGENYINSPLIIEKCTEDRLPIGREQDLVTVNTNNYNFLYSSKTMVDVYYTGFTDKCDTYCPYNQMGEYKTNPENKQVCIYYNINDKAHRNLKGSHPTWIETQFMKPPPLTLYHLNKITYSKNENSTNQAYYIDSKGISYFPIGSVWTSKMNIERKKINLFSPNTHGKASGHSAIGPEKETILVSGNILPPVDYKKIWNSKEDCIDCQPGNEITIWEPIPPEGYVCMGHLVSEINNKKELLDLSNKLDSPIMCVPESCAIKIPIGPEVWNSEKLMKKEFGTETFEPADRFMLFLNCYLQENNNRTSSEIMSELDNFIDTEKERLKDYNVDTITQYAYVDIQSLIEELIELKNMKLLIDWDKNNAVKLYKDTNKIVRKAQEIEEKYQRRFFRMKDDTLDEIKKRKLKITPRVTKTKPVYIYSAGVDKAYEESINMPGVQLKNDQGHNLFFAVTNKKRAPKFAYKINRACLYKKKYNPIKLNSVPGVLDHPGAPLRNRNKSSEQYFTCPKDLIIETINSDFSPTKEPKRYYLSFTNNNDNPPTYFIRAPNVKTRDFSLCKSYNINGEIIDDVFDTKNERALFIIRRENGEENCNFNNNEKVSIRNKGSLSTDGETQYFNQFYTPFGKNFEELTIESEPKFIIKRVI